MKTYTLREINRRLGLSEGTLYILNSKIPCYALQELVSSIGEELDREGSDLVHENIAILERDVEALQKSHDVLQEKYETLMDTINNLKIWTPMQGHVKP